MVKVTDNGQLLPKLAIFWIVFYPQTSYLVSMSGFIWYGILPTDIIFGTNVSQLQFLPT